MRLPKQKTVLITTVLVLIIGIGGYFGAKAFMQRGGNAAASVAMAFPADTDIFASASTNPSIDQKLELYRTLSTLAMQQKDPLERSYGLSDVFDSRSAVVQPILDSLRCPDNFDVIFGDWLGNGVGWAQGPSSSNQPVVAFQTDDFSAAKTGLMRLSKCLSSQSSTTFVAPGFARSHGYVLMAPSQAIADAVARAASGTEEHSTLYQLPQFSPTARSQQPTVATVYVRSAAAKTLLESALARSSGGVGEALLSRLVPEPTAEQKASAWRMNLIVTPQSLEFQADGSHLALGPQTKVADTKLPDDSMLALGGVTNQGVGSGAGSGTFSIAADASALDPLAFVLSGGHVAIGARTTMVASETVSLKEALPRLISSRLSTESHANLSTLSTSPHYAQKLLAGGQLGALPTFKTTVPDAPRAQYFAFLNLAPRGKSVSDGMAQLMKLAGANKNDVQGMQEVLDPVAAIGGSIALARDGTTGTANFTLLLKPAKPTS